MGVDREQGQLVLTHQLLEVSPGGVGPLGGPIGALAGMHLNAALINAYAQQIPVPAADRDAAMRAEITSGMKELGEKGFASLINRPGLGFDRFG